MAKKKKADVESEVELVEGLAEDTLEPAPEPLESPVVDSLAEDEVVVVEVEEVAPEPPVETVLVITVDSENSIGHGSWDVKFNMARKHKSPAVRKYIPQHHQR